ncbi:MULTISPECIES: hypothetical protein [unclassified Caulobacter]|uniref:hypothetical protein n=1 Tax=unclassified Caulobacter TaxID=2648921 RepID=UPI000A45E3B0|nr:hypothetical protein [Caulobacter sp. UNC358MFTsu5.1]
MGDTRTFRFEGRWKEELVVVGPAGKFVLELVAGVAYLPPEDVWRGSAPAWAADLWATLKTELEDWGPAHGVTLGIDPTATVAPFYETLVEKRSRAAARRWLWSLLALGLLAGAAWLLGR